MNIAIIPARSGSKGLPDKNIKNLCGKPLMAYSIEAAIESNCFDEIFVSTDSKKYADIAQQYGANASFLRSKELSSDTAGSWDVVREVLSEFEKRGKVFDKIMLLQPTSPLRTAEDIVNAFKLMKEKNANSILGVTETDHSPIWCNTLPKDGCMDSFINKEYVNVPRQLLPKYYRINGAIYLLTKSELYREIMFCDRCYSYVMPIEKSVDIDRSIDFFVAECLMNAK